MALNTWDGKKKKKANTFVCIFILFIDMEICVSAKVQILHQRYKTVNKK